MGNKKFNLLRSQVRMRGKIILIQSLQRKSLSSTFTPIFFIFHSSITVRQKIYVPLAPSSPVTPVSGAVLLCHFVKRKQKMTYVYIDIFNKAFNKLKCTSTTHRHVLVFSWKSENNYCCIRMPIRNPPSHVLLYSRSPRR